MRIAIAQLNIHIGNFDSNTEKILNAVRSAREQGAELVCFSELATTGYPALDLLESPHFIQKSNELLERLKEASSGIGIVIGAPRINPELPGKNLYNSAFFFANGQQLGFADKALLPTYDVFDEYRYFEPGKKFNTIEFKGKRIALTICEDIWDLVNEDPIYTFHPMDELMKDKPDLAINISASPFSEGQHRNRKKVLKMNAERYKLPFFYINHVGAQTDLIFDGGSLVVGPSGEVQDEMPFFEECVRTYELDEIMKMDGISKLQSTDRIALMHDALVFGLRDFFVKLGFKKAIMGLSGGIDSALTAALTCRALGAKNVHGLIMPSEFSSKNSVRDAEKLVENLGMSSDILDIGDIYDLFTSKLDAFFGKTPFDVTEENIQARARGILLMAYSNKLGHVLLNTTNKSEMAVGYGTLYGDLCGSLSVIGDVYKTDVYKLSNYINREEEIIPRSTIVKPPSAELKPDQKDSDSLPDYDLLDPILKMMIEKKYSMEQIASEGYNSEVVQKVWQLVHRSEFKRYQTAPVLRVSDKAFGYGRRIPLVGKF
ncbi:MAG: NAD+ synthase [Saprospirales bacterium]|nr:MAG: NAD+ synthase [Saprospirales bacterium]